MVQSANLIVLAVCLHQSISYNIEINAGAFWKELPNTISYEATIPLTYRMDWSETIPDLKEEEDTTCKNAPYSTECVIAHNIKELSQTFM